MRLFRKGLVVDVANYDILRISGDPAVAPFPDFHDVHHTDSPVWRVVSGYLMIADEDSDGEADALLIHSHGREVARLIRDDNHVRLRRPGGWALEGGVARGGGLALCLDRGPWEAGAGGDVVADATDWSVTIVHGPAGIKVENRIRLLSSLQSLGVHSG